MFDSKKVLSLCCLVTAVLLRAAPWDGWQTDFNTAQKNALETGKTIFIFFDDPKNRGSINLRTGLFEKKEFKDFAGKNLTLLRYDVRNKTGDEMSVLQNELRKKYRHTDPYGGILVKPDGSLIGNVGMMTRHQLYFQRLKRMLEPVPPIVAAARAADWKQVRSLIESEPETDVNAADGFGATALHVAAAEGNRDMAAFLLNHGAKVNMPDRDGATPLYAACLSGKNLETVRFLLGEFASVHSRKTRAAGSEVPLFAAVRGGNVEIVGLLLSEGANPNDTSRSGETPLFFAVRGENVEMIRLLLSKGANPNAVSASRTSVLSAAVQERKAKSVAVLLEANADLSIKDRHQKTALFYAENGRRRSPAIATMLRNAESGGNKKAK